MRQDDLCPRIYLYHEIKETISILIIPFQWHAIPQAGAERGQVAS